MSKTDSASYLHEVRDVSTFRCNTPNANSQIVNATVSVCEGVSDDTVQGLCSLLFQNRDFEKHVLKEFSVQTCEFHLPSLFLHKRIKMEHLETLLCCGDLSVFLCYYIIVFDDLFFFSAGNHVK